ncbi:MAG: hypothetical protein QXH42_00510 [Thermoplasmata archaeon]
MSAGRLYTAWVAVVAMAVTALTPLLPAFGEGGRPAGQNLIVSSEYRVSGTETWELIVIREGGTLIIPQGTTLNAKSIHLEGGSFIASGGTVAVTQTTPGLDAVIAGDCIDFNVSGGSKITLMAPDGAATMDLSQGGEAIVSVNASGFVRVTGGSEIKCIGGNGRGTTTPWTSGPLSGYISAGGRGLIRLGGPQTPYVELSGGSKFTTIGRDGGRAADGKAGSGGTGGQGGGYSNGGRVSGFVGSGGDGVVHVSGRTVLIENVMLDCSAGKGGDAGNGGAGSTSSGSQYYYSGGGGGGGYAGGDGGENYQSSGKSASVSDNVGAGGYAMFVVEAENATIRSATAILKGGNGGTPGAGGRGGSVPNYPYYSAGGGGGGFAGGGGGSSYATGGSGAAGGNVGAGGEANMSVSCNNLTLDGLSLFCTGGNSASGGTGGDGNYGGGGGGGYGGGGGGGGYNGGGAGTASGNVGAGGNATLVITAQNIWAVNSSLNLRGGNAGNGGTGGKGGSYGGGGGGGYGGGGGAGYYSYQGSAGSGSASSNVGRGGMALVRMTALNYLWFNSSYINATGGSGGNGGTGGSGGSNAGGGGGGYTGSGGGSYSGSAGEGQATGNTGDGGDAEVAFYCLQGSIPADFVHISAVGGTKGDGKTSAGGGSYGGKGAGRATSNGGTPRNVPLLTPIITGPPDGALFNNVMPRLTWMKMLECWIYPTTHDPIVNYHVQIDDNSTFSSPDEDEKLVDPEGASYTPSKIRGGKYYWRVRAVYETGRFSPWSALGYFFLNGPPTQFRAFPAISFPEDGSLENALNLNEYFTDDIYPGELSYSVVYEQEASKVHAVVNGTWLSVYSGTRDWYGTRRIGVRATDRGGVFTDSELINVTIAPVNDPPYFAELPVVNVTEDTFYTFDLGPFVGDVDNNPGQLRLTMTSLYAQVEGLNITFHYPIDIGGESINLTLSDGSATANGVLEVKIRGVNDRPVTLPIPPLTTNEDTNLTLDLAPFAFDEEDAPSALRWRAENIPAELLTVEIDENNTLRIYPLPNLSGEGTMLLIVRDTGGLEAMVNLTLKVLSVNDPPVIAPIPPQTVRVGVPLTLDLRPFVSDVDNEPSQLRVMVSTIYASVQGFTVTFNYPHDENLEKELVRITVSDGKAAGHVDIQILLSFPPSFIEAIGELRVEVGREVQIDLTMYANDREDGQFGLRFNVTGVDRGLLEVSIDANGLMRVKSLGKTGRDDITVSVTDSDGNTVVTNVTVVIVPRPVSKGGIAGDSGFMLWAGPAALVAAILGGAIGFYLFALRRKQRIEAMQAAREREGPALGSSAQLLGEDATKGAGPARAVLTTRVCYACGSRLLLIGEGVYQCRKCGRTQK